MLFYLNYPLFLGLVDLLILPIYSQIKSEYDYIGKFKEGFAIVKKGEKWGFIDKDGKPIGKFIYDWACDFSEGRAAVRKGEKWSFIDKNGKPICEFIYDETRGFS